MKKISIKTKYGSYEATIEPDEKGYMVVVPSLPGVATWGKNITHAKKMAQEAIELCVECLVEDNLKQRIERVERQIKEVRERVAA